MLSCKLHVCHSYVKQQIAVDVGCDIYLHVGTQMTANSWNVDFTYEEAEADFSWFYPPGFLVNVHITCVEVCTWSFLSEKKRVYLFPVSFKRWCSCCQYFWFKQIHDTRSPVINRFILMTWTILSRCIFFRSLSFSFFDVLIKSVCPLELQGAINHTLRCTFWKNNACSCCAPWSSRRLVPDAVIGDSEGSWESKVGVTADTVSPVYCRWLS